MSAISVRRPKDRVGAEAKIAAPKGTKSITPTSNSKSTTGKENFKPSHGVSTLKPVQKPTIKAVPRIAKDGVQQLPSTLPRGRSPSPFGRSGSEVKKDKALLRVSLDRSEVMKKEERGKGDLDLKGDGNASGLRILSELREKVKRNGRIEKSDARVESRNKSSGINEDSDLGAKSSGKPSSGVVNSIAKGNSSGKSSCDAEKEVQGGILKDGRPEERHSSFPKTECIGEKAGNSGDKSSSSLGISEKLKEKGSVGSSISQGGSKYSSRLHEKLAFLEGKVKRIALDIKRTKEMLDMNNPDASKVIISDIQEKISGIEKAINHAVSDPDSLKSMSNGATKSEKTVEKIQSEEPSNSKSSVKGLNSEELEARLFPHHKLLRNRTSKAPSTTAESSSSAGVDEVTSSDASVTSKLQGKSLCSIKEKPTASKLLASLNEEQSKITIGSRQPAVLEFCEVQETDGVENSLSEERKFDNKVQSEIILTADERLDEFDDQENGEVLMVSEENEDSCIYPLNEIGHKTTTSGWFVSEGEAVLLTHDDGSCSYYDIVNCEEKSQYKTSFEISPNIWRDCWIVRAPSADGCSGRYVVAASAGNTMDSGFCSWDFYTKDVRAFHVEDGGTKASRTVLGPLPNNTVYRRNVLSNILIPETQQWWYKPCGPLMMSTATCQKSVRMYDIRDGEQVMNWDLQKPVLMMDYSSPLQWRSKGKVVIAESETISLWDVSSVESQALVSVPSSGRKIVALHVSNTDAEIGGGVRQRVTSSEAEGNDGVFCTADSINVLDFRHPSGVGLRIQKLGVAVQSVYSRGDSVFVGCWNSRPGGKKQSGSQLQQFSLRKGSLFSTYALPESNVHYDHSAITQVWGNSNLVMGVSGMGLFVFDTMKEEVLHAFDPDCASTQNVRDIIGPNDLYCPSFDYSSSRSLLISRDRPALWRHLP